MNIWLYIQLIALMASLETENADQQNTEQTQTKSSQLKDEQVLPLFAELAVKDGNKGAGKTNSRRKSKGGWMHDVN